jgi:hypothetical protein
VSSDHRLSRGFCWPARVEPGDVEVDDRDVVFAVAVVAEELEERIRRGMCCGLLLIRVRPLILQLPLPLILQLPLPLLLMLALGRRVVMLLALLFMLMLKDRLDLRGR